MEMAPENGPSVISFMPSLVVTRIVRLPISMYCCLRCELRELNHIGLDLTELVASVNFVMGTRVSGCRWQTGV